MVTNLIWIVYKKNITYSQPQEILLFEFFP